MTAGLCMCGCGEPTRLASQTSTGRGTIKGQPLRFVHGHNGRKLGPEYVEEDRGHDTPCWIWQRAILKRSGYGLLQSTVSGMAHRVYWERVNGPVPEGLELDHLCRVRECCNPDHLEAVTHAENVRRSPFTKLTAADVREIRASTESGARLGLKYGVNRNHINDIRRGRRWKDIAA